MYIYIRKNNFQPHGYTRVQAFYLNLSKIYSQPNTEKHIYTRLSQSNLPRLLYRAWIAFTQFFLFMIYVYVRHRGNKKGDYYIALMYQMQIPGRVVLFRRDFRFPHFPRLDWPFSRDQLLHPLKYVHDDSYDLLFELIARAYSTGTTLLLTPRS